MPSPGGPFQPITGRGIPVQALDNPPEGRRIGLLDAPIVLSASNFSPSLGYPIGNAPATMSQVRTIQVNNAANAQALTIIHGVALATFVVPAGGGAIIPTASARGASVYPFFLSTPAAPTIDTAIDVQLFNYEIPPAVWGTQIVLTDVGTPTGGIIVWYGALNAIPPGWGLCDGTVYQRADGSGTIASPNLTNRFVLGTATSPNTFGGSTKITVAQLPAHNHGLDIGFTEGAGTSLHADGISAGASDDGLLAGAITGTGSGDDYLPPWFALGYIMKL